MTTDETRALAVARGLGLDVQQAETLPGVVNVVVRVSGDRADAVVRFAADDSRPNEFPLEEWCYGAARSAGIPSPAVLGSGVHEGVEFLVLEYVQATSAEPIEHWRWLGRYASLIAQLPIGDDAPEELFSRFGRDLPRAWAEHVRYNIAALDEHDDLLALGVYPPSEQGRLTGLLASLDRADFEFGLAHGDLAPRNLIPATGAPVLIDWGAATTGPAPWTDVLTVYQWAVDAGTVPLAAFRTFAHAAGIDPVRAAPTLDALSALRHLDLARWAVARRPDLVPRYVQAARDGLARVLG
ncbi:phosphotransferase [Leifsonia sp. NPDC058292]|uniref:phosphotransferase n=1 Tax=Leifsonia sp. NPDC058292 TaxID=3346428 RepID=UPI0036D95889